MIENFFNVSYSPFIHENGLRQLLNFQLYFDDEQRYIDVLNFCDKISFNNEYVIDLGSNIGTYSISIAKYFNTQLVFGIDKNKYFIDIAKALAFNFDLTHKIYFIHSNIDFKSFNQIYDKTKQSFKLMLIMGLGQLYKDKKLKQYLRYGVLRLKPEYVISSIEPDWLMRRNYLFHLINTIGKNYDKIYETDWILVFKRN